MSHFLNSKITTLMQLAIGLVVDLGLNRLPRQQNRASDALVNEPAVLLKPRNLGADHTLQEMRAGLGCFYLISLCVPPLVEGNVCGMSKADGTEDCPFSLDMSPTFPSLGLSLDSARLC